LFFLYYEGFEAELMSNLNELLRDDKNIEILNLLHKNPRSSVAELARQVGMSNPAVKERVLRLEESGVIAGYRLDLDPKELGHEVIAFVRIRPLPGHLPKIAELAQRIPEVTECHRITGEDCFILKVYLPDIASLDTVLDRFLVHGQTTTSIVQSSPVPPRPPKLPSSSKVAR
jgi:Lrp/AsnC family leucine-responsive transcriptional regulator